MSRIALTLIAAAALTASGGSIAGEIYKWTDEDGISHYMDRPTGQPSEQRLAFISTATNDSAVRDRVQARHERQAARQESRATAAERQQSEAETLAQNERRQQQCQMYRSRLQNFLRSRRLYQENDAHERTYLDDDQILEAREKVQDMITETCS
ncbi:MAG: DUF4124 domain-containing protein [Proteobacteria bacterium]|nr:DUF4124 domain-containing protein [Pseudomonadota bacterium]